MIGTITTAEHWFIYQPILDQTCTSNPPPHQCIDRNLKLIWVTWGLLTKVCKSIDSCLFFHQNADLSRVVCSETRICSSAPPVCQYRWMFTLSVDLRLFRLKMSTWHCCQSLQAATATAFHSPHHRPASCLLCGISKLQQPKCFYNQVKKKKGGIKKSQRIYIWDDWKIKS